MNNDTAPRRDLALLRWTTVSLAFILAACASPSTSLTPHGDAGPGDFPPIESAMWKQGSAPGIEALRQMTIGVDKDRVRSLLSWPHFREGIAGVREWNYILHLRAAGAQDSVTCQYMVRFDTEMLTSGMYWKDPACAALVTASPAKIVVRPLAPAPFAAPSPGSVTLSSDSLFRAGGTSVEDLRPDGLRTIELLAAEIRRHFGLAKSIVVTAHTDRLGAPARADSLSLAHANAVRDILGRQGIDPQIIHTEGHGQKEPLVECPGASSPAVSACLRPNRRIDIEIKGAQ